MFWGSETKNENQVLVFQVQCEGDIAWGGKRSDLVIENPPVYALARLDRKDQDTWIGTTWKTVGIEDESHTDWVLNQIVTYMPSETWINLRIPKAPEKREALLGQMRGYFQRSSRFGKFEVFESKNQMTAVRDESPRARMYFRKPVDYKQLPGWVSEHSSDSKLKRF